jgi:curved DNA-binding protein CbpA
MDNNFGRIPFEMTFKKDNKHINNINYIDELNNIDNLSDKTKEDDNIKNIEFKKKQKSSKKKIETQKNNNEYKYDKKDFLEEFMKLHNDLYFNPYKIMNLDKNYDKKNLKKMYKKLALIYHPDRPDGNEITFKEITQAYLYLLKKLKENIPDKQIIDLRNEYNDFVKQQEEQNYENIYNNSQRFNLNNFNKIFEDYKDPNINDDGYNDFMKEQLSNKEDNNSYIFSNKFNIEIFNKIFENDTDNLNNNIVVFKEPSELSTYNNNYEKLGEGKIDDYTSDFTFGKQKLQYTDCKKAYTKNDFNPQNVKYKTFNDVNELESCRSQLTYVMDEESKQNYLLKKEKNDREEKIRQERLEKQDLNILKKYKKLNIKMIGNKDFFK